MQKSMSPLLTEEKMLKINKGNNRASALISRRQLAAAWNVNGFILPINNNH